MINLRHCCQGEIGEASIRKKVPLEVELRHFITCINDNVKPLTPRTIGIRALRVAETTSISLLNNMLIEEMFDTYRIS